VNKNQIKKSTHILGKPTAEMLTKVREDTFWIMENLGVGFKQPEMVLAFKQHEKDGLAFVHKDRIYVMIDLVEK
jgi:hypothetical protein